MSDLFASQGRTGADYDAHSIEVLEGLEPVRRRPGMYIGGIDERALHHLAAEVLDNSMDEAVAGHASRIDVTLEAVAGTAGGGPFFGQTPRRPRRGGPPKNRQSGARGGPHPPPPGGADRP